MSSSGFVTGRGFPRDLRKADDSDWWRRGGLGLRGGLVLGEGSESGGLKSGITGRGICRDNLLVRVLAELKLDMGCTFQPRGSWPVMTDVGTGGGEEQEEEVEDEYDEEDD